MQNVSEWLRIEQQREERRDAVIVAALKILDYARGEDGGYECTFCFKPRTLWAASRQDVITSPDAHEPGCELAALLAAAGNLAAYETCPDEAA